MPATYLQLHSKISADASTLEVSLAELPVPTPKADEVRVRVEATPLNPSDIGLLFGAADMHKARASGTKERPVISADVPERMRPAMQARAGNAMPVGNEGAGVVIAAGASPEAQALMGRTVSMIGGGMYAEQRCLPAAQCMPLPDGTTAAEGASWFVNPMTSLGMTETMKREGHSALVHTAAASNLGQMLSKICIADGIGLVNIVRKVEQVELLRGLGAKHVVDSTSANFMTELTDAIAATGATIGFDAIGGGPLAGQILNAMEAAIQRKAPEGEAYSRYGSSRKKQVYVYGGLDRGPIEISRAMGMTWSMGGWLLFNFIEQVGPERAQQLKERVIGELKTTFASHYTREVSLAEALTLDAIGVYAAHKTGEKVLVRP